MRADFIGVSVVVPLYRSTGHVPGLVSLLICLSDRLNRDSEVIFVSDGDPENSYRHISKELLTQYFHVRIVLLKGNKGQYAATLTGMALARGQVLLTLDCDCHLTAAQLSYLSDLATPPNRLVYADMTFPFKERGGLRWLGSRVLNQMVRWSVVGIRPGASGSSIRAVNHLLKEELVIKIQSESLLDVILMNLADEVIFIPVQQQSGSSSYTKLALIRLMAGFLSSLGVHSVGIRRQPVNTDAYICETLTFPMVRDV